MKKFILLLIILSYGFPVKADSYRIEATLKNIKHGTLFFLKQYDNQKIINSARIGKGHLIMTGTLADTPQHLWLCTTINDEFYYCDLLLDNDTLHIRGCLEDFPNKLQFSGTKTHMEYARYLEKTKEVNQNIDSLNQLSMLLHEMGAVQSHSGKEKTRNNVLKQLFRESLSPYQIKGYELDVDRELDQMNKKRDSIRIDFITHNMDKPAGQFLLTRLMKKLPVDSLRYFYRLIPVEMKKSKFARIISNEINPYADNCIRQADNLLSLSGGPIELARYTEEAYKLYKQGIHLDPERTDAHIALAMMYERLLIIKGVAAYDIAIDHLNQFLISDVREEDRQTVKKHMDNIHYRKSLATNIYPEMVEVKGGTFNMGSTYSEDNNPVRKVTVSGFYISKYEITNYQFAHFLESYKSDIVKSGPNEGQPLYYECNWGIENRKPVQGYESHPAIYITWYGAREYCEWAGGRLPTEEEWEYAARGGRYAKLPHLYSGGIELDSVGWYAGNSAGVPHPVGLKVPNEIGLHDMSGNVWEWCSDLIHKNGRTYAVVKGGTWFNDRASSRPTCHFYIYPESKHFNNGFRIVKDKYTETDSIQKKQEE